MHTVLSPCAELEMLPPLIVAECLDRGIGLIAITDHNSSANIAAVQEAARNTSLAVLPGMEIQTREEVHVLCLFDTLEQIRTWQQIVDRALPNLINRSDYFGDQLIVDANGDFLNREDRLLIVSTALTIEQVWEKVNALGGLAIPAHVDRTANGLISILGMVPETIPFIALEISRHIKPALAPQLIPALQGYPLVQGGDVHRLDDLLGVNQFTLESIRIDELKKAIRGEGKRKLRILSSTL